MRMRAAGHHHYYQNAANHLDCCKMIKAKLDATTESIDNFGGNEDGSCDDAEVEGEYTFQFECRLGNATYIFCSTLQ